MDCVRTARARWLATSGQRLETRRRLGYRLEISSILIDAHPATRVVIGPNDWLGWKNVAEVHLIP